MKTFLEFVVLALGICLAKGAPVEELVDRASQQCSQYSSQTTGAYTLYTNGWGWSYGTGSQCSEIDGVPSTNAVSWDTTWTWSGGATNVKSYTNINTAIKQQQLRAYTSMATTWAWSYTGTSLSCNVAYDTFVGTSASGANVFEVMVWLGVFGGISPLSANGYPYTPIATPTIGGQPFHLAYGLNGNVKVYSFVAASGNYTNFNGNLLPFYQYLEQNYASNGFNSSLYLQSIQAGSEVFTGSNAKLTTSSYSLVVS